MRTHGVKQGRWVGVCGAFFLCPECRAAEEAERIEKMEAIAEAVGLASPYWRE